MRRATVALLVMWACAGEGDRSRDVVRLGYQRYVSYAPIFLADAEGSFARHGIDLQLVLMPDGNTGTPLLVSGELDALAGTSTPGILNVIARGAHIRLVADRGSVPDSGCSQMALVARPGIALGPRAAGNARRVSPSRAVAALDYFTETALAAAGVRIDDLEVHHLPASVHLEALNRGSIDLVATTEPAVTRLVTAGNHIVADASAVVPGLPYGFVVFGERLARNDRALGERFVMAYLEGVRAYDRGKTPGNLAVVSAATGEEVDVLSRACWPPARSGEIDTVAFGAFQDWAVGRRLLDRRLGFAEYWDGSFLSAARSGVAPR